jgi:hypothetical protein
MVRKELGGGGVGECQRKNGKWGEESGSLFPKQPQEKCSSPTAKEPKILQPREPRLQKK